MSSTASRTVRAELAEVSQSLHRRGWVANHDGNVTAKIGPGRFVATPTATSKRVIDARAVIEIDATGKVLSGSGRPFGELGLHMAVYERRDDVSAVVHAHPPHATALACSGSNALERPFIAEAVVSLGPSVPTVPFAVPAQAPSALAPFAADYDAVLIANHGVLTWGCDLEQALLRMELVEHLARIAHLAQAHGGVRYLAQDAVEPLLQSRAKASALGSAAARALTIFGKGKAVVACAPAPHSATPTVSPGGGRSDVARLVREEIVRALRENR